MSERPKHDPSGAAAASAPAPVQARRRRRRWPWVLLLLAILAVVGLRAALPLAVERGAAWGSRQYLGLPVRIENVDFALLEGRVVVEGFDIAARPDAVAPFDAALEPPPIDPEAALVHVDRIAARLSWSDLRDRTARLTELVIEAPSVRAEREADGKIDPLRHAEPAAPPSGDAEPAPEPEPEGEPWTVALDRFELRKPAVRIVDAAGGEDLVQLSLDDFLLTDLLAKGGDVSLGGLGIEGPVLRVKRSFVFGEPAAQQAAASDPAVTPQAAAARAEQQAQAAPPEAGTAPSYTLKRIDIERATVTLLTDQGPLDVALTLKASDVTAQEGKRFPFQLKLEIEDGTISVAGEAGVLPPAFTGEVKWEQLPFPPILLASRPGLTAWLRSASANGDLQVDADVGGQKGPPSVHVAGYLSLDRFGVADPEDREVSVGWTQLEIVIQELVAPLPAEGRPPGTTRVRLDSLALVEPRILYTTPSPQLDALLGGEPVAAPQPVGEAGAAEATVPAEPAHEAEATAAASPAAPAQEIASEDTGEMTAIGAEPAAEAPAPVDLAIASLEIVDGDVVFVDQNVKPSVRSTVQDLDFQARDVRFPEVQALGVRLGAVLPERAKLSVSGDLRAQDQGDFEVRLAQLTLPVFDPYASAAGASLDKGTASVETRVRLRGSRVELDNDLVLSRLGISLQDPASFEQEFGVPIDLALALLRDPSGNINISVPVAFEEGESAVEVGSIVRSAVRQALVGALTAPLKIVGAGFSVLTGGEEQDGPTAISIEPVPSAPGSVEPASDPKQRLSGLVRLLAQRPGVAIVLGGRAGPEDRPVVARQMLEERWEEEKDLPQVAEIDAQKNIFERFVDRFRLGRAMSKSEQGEEQELSPQEAALYEQYVKAIDVPEERLRALATSRAERVRALLVEAGADPARVVVGESATDEEPSVAINLGAA